MKEVRTARRLGRITWPLAFLLVACGDRASSADRGDSADAPRADSPAAAAPAHDWLIVPDTRIGPVREGTSERALIELLGAGQVVRREAYIGEGFCAPGSLLYPGSAEELEVLWADSTYSAPAAARVASVGSRWRSARGVGVGTTLGELEQIKGATVEFGGFGWDWGGASSWNEPGAEGSGTIALELAPNPDSLTVVSADPRYPEVLGERTVGSDHPLVRRLDVRVERVTVRLGTWPAEHECALP